MWREYSVSYIKNNKATSISLMMASFIASLFLSLITSVFYNMWMDSINQIVSTEGDWHGRITISISREAIETIQGFSGVKKAITTETENGVETLLYFNDMRKVYEVMPSIAKTLEIDPSEVQYNDKLLSAYFVFSPEDEKPPLLLGFYVFIMVIASISLILIIRNAFLVSMQARLHQFGILQSIGATPRQIRICLLQEALALCLIPIFTGILGGVLLCMGVIEIANGVAGAYRGENAIFYYNFGLFLISFLASFFTVLFSVWLPARKLSKLSSLQIIKGEEDRNALRKMKSFRLFSFLFGIEGELARKSLYTRRKALRTANLSLTLSFLTFSIFLCFITISGISTKYTYFERYKDAWDIMATVKNENIEDIEALLNSATLNDLEALKVYQKVDAYTWITGDLLSDDIKDLGGLSEITGSQVEAKDNKYKVKVPLVILDDKSFEAYCQSLGINLDDTSDGMITVNQIWDSKNSNFRYKEYIPFIKEQDNMALSLLQGEEGSESAIEVPVLAFTDKKPVLREEYGNYALLQVISESSFQNFISHFSIEPRETYINVQTTEDKAIKAVQEEIELLLSNKAYEIENRVEEEINNKEIQKGYTLIMGGFCGLLAIIGLANIFSNTLGYIFQRKREFARYLSIGLSPQGIKKILVLEALIIGGKPIVIAIPFTVIFIFFATTASYLNPMEFFEIMPIIPILIMVGVILGSVALAYYLGGRRIFKSNLIEVLKNDTLS